MGKPRDERPEAEENLGVFLNPSGASSGGHYIVPLKPLHVGPGKPGPGDEWHLPPLEPGRDTTATEDSGPKPGERP